MTQLRTLAAKYSFCSLLLLAALSFAASNALAIPISEYRENLQRATSQLETLLIRNVFESDADYDTRLKETINAVRSELPKNQQVEWEKGVWNTDNAWFHKTLDELQNEAAEERLMKLERLLEWLRSVDERVKDLNDAQAVDENKAEAKQKLESILARPEYVSGPGGQNAISRLIRDFFRWLEKWLPESPAVSPGRANITSFIVQVVVVATALLLILYVARLLFIRFRRPRKVKIRKKREARIVLGEKLQPEETSTDLLAEAEALARSGDLRAAIRKGYIALLVELGDRNVISLAQHKTNRDYLRSVSNRPQLHSPLQKLTESFERHWYGFAQATPTDWQDFRSGYREALQTGN